MNEFEFNTVKEVTRQGLALKRLGNAHNNLASEFCSLVNKHNRVVSLLSMGFALTGILGYSVRKLIDLDKENADEKIKLLGKGIDDLQEQINEMNSQIIELTYDKPDSDSDNGCKTELKE